MSLGLLTLRLLLANDGQDTTQLNSRLAASLAEAVVGDPDASGDPERDRLHQAFQAEGIASRPTEVLHRQIDRETVDTAIPAANVSQSCA